MLDEKILEEKLGMNGNKKILLMSSYRSRHSLMKNDYHESKLFVWPSHTSPSCQTFLQFRIVRSNPNLHICTAWTTMAAPFSWTVIPIKMFPRLCHLSLSVEYIHLMVIQMGRIICPVVCTIKWLFQACPRASIRLPYSVFLISLVNLKQSNNTCLAIQVFQSCYNKNK